MMTSDESDDERRQASRRQRQRAAGTQSALARPPPFVGAAVSVLPLPQAADHERVRDEQIIGDKRPRDARGCDDDLAQAAASDEPMTSPDNATHTVLFPRGSGGFVQRQNACSRHHYVQKKLGSVAYIYGRAQEFVWYHFQMIVKRSLHQSAPRVVNATIAMNADAETVTEHTKRLREQWEQLKRAAPEYVPYCSSKETYTGTVGKQVVGSKAYWSEARAELIAMSMEFDTPTHWATFTCNETGWSDLKAACGGEHHSQRPVEATRQYNHRWQLSSRRT